MNILVTGSTGFVGRYLVSKLIFEKHQILELTRDLHVSTQLYGNNTQKHLIDDDQNTFAEVVEVFKPDVVIHLASYLTSQDDYSALNKLLDSNITFFCRLLDALKNIDLKLFVNTGTFAEYYKGDDVFDPAYLYAATKTASRSFLDYYSKVYNFKQTTVVPYTIYGGTDTQKKVIDYIYDSTSSDIPVDMSPGEQVLDFIHIEDVTNFYVEIIGSIDKLPIKSNFKLGTGEGHTLKNVAELIETISGRKTNINWGGKAYRLSDVMYAVAEPSKLINWVPVLNLESGIRNYLNTKMDK